MKPLVTKDKYGYTLVATQHVGGWYEISYSPPRKPAMLHLVFSSLQALEAEMQKYDWQPLTEDYIYAQYD